RHRLRRARGCPRARGAPLVAGAGSRALRARSPAAADRFRTHRDREGRLMRRHVILITYGEPPRPAFTGQLRYSWRILLGLTRVVAPLPGALLPMIAVGRGRSRHKLWTEEHYGSPLEAITWEQARGLEEVLRADHAEHDWRVHVAYEFRDPLLTTMLDRLPP